LADGFAIYRLSLFTTQLAIFIGLSLSLFILPLHCL
jgi:hypothetical protein